MIPKAPAVTLAHACVTPFRKAQACSAVSRNTLLARPTSAPGTPRDVPALLRAVLTTRVSLQAVAPAPLTPPLSATRRTRLASALLQALPAKVVTPRAAGQTSDGYGPKRAASQPLGTPEEASGGSRASYFQPTAFVLSWQALASIGQRLGFSRWFDYFG